MVFWVNVNPTNKMVHKIVLFLALSSKCLLSFTHKIKFNAFYVRHRSGLKIVTFPCEASFSLFTSV